MELYVLFLVGGLLIIWLGVVLVGPPYVPTHMRQVQILFRELGITNRDHVVDLGAGDGRVLAIAAQHGARVSGVELNPFLVWFSRIRLRKFPDATVQLGDIWRYSLPSDTTYVFVFFAHTFMPRLERYLEAQGKKVRLISYGFGFSNRTPVQVIGAFNIYEF